VPGLQRAGGGAARVCGGEEEFVVLVSQAEDEDDPDHPGAEKEVSGAGNRPLSLGTPFIGLIQTDEPRLANRPLLALTARMPAQRASLDTLLIPAEDKSSRRLWIMLHGLGDSVDGYRWMQETFQLPWMNYLLVNAPDHYFGGHSWFDFSDDADPDVMRPGVERSRKLLFELLDAQRAAGFSPEQTVLGGFSQGCLMSLDVATRYPHRLAGVVGISGYVCEPERIVRELSPVAKEQKFLVTHGTYDPLLAIEATRGQIQLLQRAGLNIRWEEFRKEHTIAGQAEIMMIREFVAGCFV
jgi:phospholipase/carboxylesterase